ncbi:MAG: DNA-3-methyladenine glycosylase [Candidatus Aminicenantales bacterium]
MILPISFYSYPTLEVLENLIGAVLVRKTEEGITSGIIVEAEAYRGEDDPASFAFRGITKRSARLYGPPGRAFVYLTYGLNYLLNIVTERENFPAAVLIRALEPKEGIELMKKRRQKSTLLDLCSGPAKLCQALAVGLDLNGASVCSPSSPLFIKKGKTEPGELVWKPRIGIREGKDRLWRVYLKDSPYVSFK